MKYIRYSGAITDENISEVLEAINNIPNDESITIYLDSEGGECTAASVLLDVIDENKDRIILKPLWVIASSAFNICYNTKAKVKLLGDVWGAVHVTSKLSEFRDVLNPEEFDHHYAKWYRKDFKKDVKELSALGLDEKEIDQIKQGKTIIINPTRMQTIFKRRNDEK